MKVVQTSLYSKHDNLCGEPRVEPASEFDPHVFMETEVQELSGGDWLKVECVDMTQAELDALPDFPGR